MTVRKSGRSARLHFKKVFNKYRTALGCFASN